MPRKITLGSPKGGASSVVVELGPGPTRFGFVPYTREVEDEITAIGKELDDLDDAADPSERVRLLASQLDVLLAPKDEEDGDVSPGDLVYEEYIREGSDLTQRDVAKLCEQVGKEARPT